MPDVQHGNESRNKSLESRVTRKCQARFGGGPTEKDQQWYLAGGLPYTSEARLAALDTRLLICGQAAPQCKINALVDRVAWLYHTYDAAKATQLIFCDLATPKGKREPAPEVAEVDASAPPAEETTAAEQSNQND